MYIIFLLFLLCTVQSMNIIEISPFLLKGITVKTRRIHHRFPLASSDLQDDSLSCGLTVEKKKKKYRLCKYSCPADFAIFLCCSDIYIYFFVFQLPELPDINWEKYTSNLDFSTFGTHRHMTRLKRQLMDGTPVKGTKTWA